jgi:enediyne biosynthesis protein E4
VKNRLYDVRSGESIRFPEIPCDYAATWASAAAYRSCVGKALNQAVASGLIPASARSRFLRSALRAYTEAH